MYWDWHSTCVECLRFHKDLDLAMSVACQAHSYKWKREEFLALFARPVPESTFFFSQTGSFGGSSKTSSVLEVSVSCQEAVNDLPKVEMATIPEVFLLVWIDTKVGLILHVLLVQAVPLIQTESVQEQRLEPGVRV